ncbi:hypothetical protein BDD12DRAFT_32787 [Trichophaea hybrida]|nr:hypothetical protein BDD12DRAFT_32787 [Trichophaea hybrida]
MDESKTNSTPLPDAPIPANIVTLLSEFKTLATMDIAEEEVIKISEQLLLQKDANWGDLLSAAPRTLCSIAQCFAIAWSEGADKFAQDKDNTMPKHLRTNLVDCSDLGRETFREAESKMNRVSTTIRNIVEFDGVIDKILDILGEENPKTSELSEKFMKLERLAKECVVDTDAVVQRSKTWEIKVSKVTTAYASTNARKSVPAKVGVFVMRRTPSFKITNVWPPRLSFSWNRELHQAQQKVGILNPPKRVSSDTL